MTILQPRKRSPELVQAGISSSFASLPLGCAIMWVMAQRRRDVGAERLAQRLDQRRIGQRAVDLVGGDDTHQAARRDVG